MRDEHHSALVLGQEVLEPRDRLDVQVVRRFVEQQHVGLGHERASQEHASTPAAGERVNVRGAVEREARQHQVHFMIAAPVLRVMPLEAREPFSDDVEDRLLRGERHVLHQPGNPQRGLMPDGPGVGRHLAAENLQQRGLARAVAADDRHPLARFELQRHVVEQRQVSEGVRDMVEGQ